MSESYMHLQDIISSPSLTGHNRSMSSIRLNLLTKSTFRLKTPGGILVTSIQSVSAGLGDTEKEIIDEKSYFLKVSTTVKKKCEFHNFDLG